MYEWEIREVNRTLMRDIWVLWTFHDIPVIRYLDWHLRLDETLLTMAETTFLTPEACKQNGMQLVTQTREDSVEFIRILHRLYQSMIM